MKAVETSFNQDKALVGAISVIVKTSRTFVCSSIKECQLAPEEEEGKISLVRLLQSPLVTTGHSAYLTPVFSLTDGSPAQPSPGTQECQGWEQQSSQTQASLLCGGGDRQRRVCLWSLETREILPR